MRSMLPINVRYKTSVLCQALESSINNLGLMIVSNHCYANNHL